MPKAVTALVIPYAIAVIHIVSASHILDNLQTRPDRDHLGRAFYCVSQLLNIVGILDDDSVVIADMGLIGNAGTQFGQSLTNSLDGLIRQLFITQKEPQLQLVRSVRTVKCKSG